LGGVGGERLLDDIGLIAQKIGLPALPG